VRSKNAVRLDCLQAEHFKIAKYPLLLPLQNLFSSIIAHSYIPQIIMSVQIIPILKKRGLDPTTSSNNRPIAITSILSKILELIILNMYGNLLQTSPNQFGYKKGVGTEMAIYALKQVAHHHLRNITSIFLCYIHASKAYDKVNHFTLLCSG